MLFREPAKWEDGSINMTIFQDDVSQFNSNHTTLWITVITVVFFKQDVSEKNSVLWLESCANNNKNNNSTSTQQQKQLQQQQQKSFINFLIEFGKKIFWNFILL